MLHQLFFWALIIIGYFVFRPQTNTQTAKNKARVHYIVYVSVILVLQSGLRHVTVGSDTYQYALLFRESQYLSWQDIWHYFYTVYIEGEGKDAGYNVLQRLFHYLSDDYQIYLLFVALTFISAFGRLLYRFTDDIAEVFLAVSTYLLMFYNFFSITGIRQTIAVALSIHCFFAMLDRKYWLFILLGIPAFFIHKSAMMIPLIPILFWFRWRKWLNRGIVLLFVVALINREYIIQTTKEVSDYVRDYVAPSLPYNLMMFFFVFSFFIAYSMRFFPREHIVQNLYNLYIPTFAMIPLLSWDSLFMREVLFFSVYSCVLIPKGLKFTFKLSSPIVIVYVILCIFQQSYKNDYAFFWEEMSVADYYEYQLPYE